MAVQGTSLWVKHCPKGLHQTGVSCGEGNGTLRHMVPRLFGRFVDNLPNQRVMPSTHAESPAHPCQLRLHSQPPKVTPISFSGIYLAGDRVESTITHSASYTRQNTVSSNIPQFHSSVSNLHQTGSHAITGPSKLYRLIRPSGQSSPFSNKDHIMPFSSSISKQTHLNPIQLENQTL